VQRVEKEELNFNALKGRMKDMGKQGFTKKEKSM